MVVSLLFPYTSMLCSLFSTCGLCLVRVVMGLNCVFEYCHNGCDACTYIVNCLHVNVQTIRRGYGTFFINIQLIN